MRTRLDTLLLTLAFIVVAPAAAMANGTISGGTTVDGSPTSGLCVTAFDGATTAGNAVTAGDGTYSTPLPAGSYTVRFDDCGTGFTSKLWYPSALTQDVAVPVEVANGGDTPDKPGASKPAGFKVALTVVK